MISDTASEPIAIIGTGCRFPGQSNTPARLWSLLENPRDILKEIPTDRFSAEGFHNADSNYHGNSNVLHSYFLDENVRQFDARFFGIKPIEANAIDPQQRLLLEAVYEGLEAAGQRIEDLQGSDTAVYVGVMCGDYEAKLLRDLDTIPTYHATGVARSILSNRISYLFDWRGPSMTIDTACSSSLVALHQAVQTLRQGDSRVAIAAGTNLILGPENYIAESKLKMLSPTGRSRMWDADADGYARGEGVAAVVLKKLSDAVRDNDHIECIVREIGLNQDGRTDGITMPSPSSQASLIRQVYSKTGLDPRNETDRCQFFECHGTGTPAGDPVEAQAIHDAFFGADTCHRPEAVTPLYVGSIKTVVGHTEGTAGLAAVIKMSLALQRSVIPPNLHFNRLNPNIKPFYNYLHIPTAPIPWPAVAAGQPRRASVNSFGFGGANAHVILESYQSGVDMTKTLESCNDTAATTVPFLFSASSQRSLKSLLSSYSAYLKESNLVDIRNLAWTLYSRRSVLSVRAFFVAANIGELISKLDAAIESENIGIETTSKQSSPPKILGIFTGQGAQWAAMGRELIRQSPFAKSRLQLLDAQLQRLPTDDRPSWSLLSKLVDGGDISEACLSQPICTAVQVLLVDLLQIAGIKFHTVVGHSSGEIAAAYAAGYITAEDACCVAYYRGMHASIACGANGQPGKMMAVATSRDDAQELCGLPYFRGRICVAAANAPNSVTLSGDADAILQAQVVFEDEEKTAKILFVDKAYHSHHMQRSAVAYEKSLSSFRPKFFPSSEATGKWFSSVYNEEFSNISEGLHSDYWNANMVNAVLFADAVGKAYRESGPFDAAIEVGPHPALKSPTLKTVEEIPGVKGLPYTGVLQRGQNDIKAFAAGIGSLWAALGSVAINIREYEDAITGPHPRSLLVGLPTYSWDKEREFWHESRVSRNALSRKEPTHELLGNLLPDGTEGKEYRWRNFLSVKEVAWLDGHKLQQQTVFPAAGYASMAFEASKELCGSRTAKMIEVQDMTIHNALVFREDDVAVETLFTLTNVTEKGDNIGADFSLYATTGDQADTLLAPKASGTLKIILGEPNPNLLPARREPEPLMINVDRERFYSALETLGYGYSGPFKALDNLTRKAGVASGTLTNMLDDTNYGDRPLLIHPAALDTAIQAIILAYCYPHDGNLWSIHVPTQIHSIRINPTLCAEHFSKTDSFFFDATQTARKGPGLFGDVDVYNPSGEYAIVQLQGVQCVPFSQATAADDTKIFSRTVWGPVTPDCNSVCWDGRATESQYQLARDLERACLYYLNSWEQDIPQDHLARTEGSYKGLFRFSSHIRTQVSRGKNKYCKREWMNDTEDVIQSIREKHGDNIDMKMVEAVGRNIPLVVRGETTILEHLFKDDLLTRYYADALPFPSYTRYLARTVKQLTHRYPAMKILEVGAGTGHATRQIFKEIGQTFQSYHFTDISSGFFEKAQQAFEDYEDKMSFQVLDIENDISTQGYQTHSFDLVVASFVLHATAKLETTLRNVRRLLKPGGYLFLLEVTDNEPMRSSFSFGSLPGWWAGEEDGRLLSPCVEPVVWDSLLRQTGFSGVDSITDDVDGLPFPASVMTSQAVDDRINLLREPIAELRSLDHKPIDDDLIIIGGSSLKTSRLINQVRALLSPMYKSVASLKDWEEMEPEAVTSTTSILNLSDLDQPVFAGLTERSFDGMKSAFENAKLIVWITEGCHADNPHANMSVGFGRSMLWEAPALKLQFIDYEHRNYKPEGIAEALLRFELATNWDSKGQMNNMLWSIELEILDTNNDIMVPRLVAHEEQNKRYNSARREILEQVNPMEFCVTAIDDGSHINLDKGPRLEDLEKAAKGASSSTCLMNVQLSSTLPVPIGTNSRLFVLFGTDHNSGETMIGLSETNASAVLLPFAQAVKVATLDDEEQFQLFSMAIDCMLVVHIFSGLLEGDTLLVHEPSSQLAGALSRRSAKKGIDLQITTTQADSPSRGWVHLAPFLNDSGVAQKLPHSIQKFVNFSSSAESHDISFAIRRCLPRYCKRESVETIFENLTYISRADSDEVLQEHLDAAVDFALSDIKDNVPTSASVDAIPISDLRGPNEGRELTTLVATWPCTTDSAAHLPVTIKPADSKPLFSPDCTYWLVGLTGDLGLSLCQWMIRLGAKYVVLSSRNPKVDKKWLANAGRMGATVRVFSCDVTDMANLRECYTEISRTLPPLGGVAQGAMVLRDTAVRDMDFDTMMKVTAPKVQGSINLEEIVGDRDLDFFVYFSSITEVVGNIGQSNYTAANAFMVSLAAQRRKRGLAASIINIGVIIGVGYVTREASQAGQENLYKGGYMWMSEQTFHQIFAEAVIAGRRDSGLETEISTGLRHIKPSEENKPIWFDNPRFSHHVLTTTAGDAGPSNGGIVIPLKLQLEEATTQEEVFNIVRNAFLTKLQRLLKADPSEGRTEASVLALRTDDLGIDSLVAVEVRTWFLKNLFVNVPVLKILGGARIGEILEHALSQASKDLTPKLGQSTDTKAKAAPVTQPIRLSDVEAPSSSNLTPLSANGSEDVIADNSSATSLSTDPHQGEKEEIANEPKPLAVERYGPLSHGQSMFWFVNIFVGDPTTLNHTGLFRIRGKLRISDLKLAITKVAMAHESLRTCFYADPQGNGQVVQGIMEHPKLHLETQRITDEEEVSQKFNELTAHIYDLEKGETMRIIVLTKSSSEHYFLIGCHHINVDGLSHQVLMRDIEMAYNGEPLGKPLQYLDFTLRQREELLNSMWTRELTYWKGIFREIPQPIPVLSLPDAQSRTRLTNYNFHKTRTRLSPELTKQINQQSRNLKVTPFHFYLVAFQVALVRLSDAEDFCIGIGDANRTGSDMLGSIGPYVNLLPLRFSGHFEERTFADVAQETRKNVLEALAHSRVPFSALLDVLNVSRSEYHSPLFQTFVDYREGAKEKTTFGDMQLEMLDFETGRTAYDVNLDIVDNPAGCMIDIMVQCSLYSQGDAELFADSYETILGTFSKYPDQVLCNPVIFSDEKIRAALNLSRGPSYPSQWPETLIHRVADVVREFGKNPAIKDGHGNLLTYEQMFSRTSSIAMELSDSGGKQGSTIAVFQERTSDWVCSLLAIMHVGAIYIPLDPSSPIERLISIVDDCHPAAILVDRNTVDKVSSLKAEQVMVVNVSSILQDSVTGCVPIGATAHTPGVILYTSGSTGTPKGITIRHSSLRNEIEFSALTYGLGAERVLQQSAMSFDMSLTQIFGALAFGGYVYICPSSMHADPISLSQLMASEQITMTGGTPSEYISWIRNGLPNLQNSPWKIAISGGEPVTTGLTHAFRSLGKTRLSLFNAYGPTEVTCSSNRGEVMYKESLSTPISAGKAAPNAYIYIVDSCLHPLPVGCVGEIVVGGAGVAMGYLHRESETRKRFVHDKITTHKDPMFTSGQSLHRTGDLGRLLSDGSLIVEGRIGGDTQVKLHGIRIDLQDVERAILQAGQGRIIEAVASVRRVDDEMPRFIVAHVVLSKETLTMDQGLEEALPLPRHMKPSLIIPVSSLPKGSSGKVDRKRVASLALDYDHVPGCSATQQLMPEEAALKETWSNVLPDNIFRQHNITGKTDFFHVGGNSLLLVNLQRCIRENYGVHLDLAQLFESSTLNRMGWLIKERTAALQEDVIDWNVETELTRRAVTTTDTPAVMANLEGGPRVVVLTGATGYLGRALLEKLVVDDLVQSIYCIAVRRPTAELAKSDKVRIYRGNLGSPMLGLSEEDAEHIFAKASVIIHNGANVSHLKHYRTLRAENVSSTKELIQLALPRRIPIHYVSTAGVSLYTGVDEFGEVSAAANPPPTDGADGYTASKWASEVVLEKAARTHDGLAITIHRPSNIKREDVPELDLFQNLLKFSRLAAAVPSSPKLRGFLNLVTADDCAGEILTEALRQVSSPACRYFHRIGDVNIRLEDLEKYMAGNIGRPTETLPLLEWTERAEGLGLHPSIASFFRRAEQGGQINYPLLVRGS
ncbi:putative Hybrid PKS-NRPS biosynthetic cluster [Microsporum audouinii]